MRPLQSLAKVYAQNCKYISIASSQILYFHIINIIFKFCGIHSSTNDTFKINEFLWQLIENLLILKPSHVLVNNFLAYIFGIFRRMGKIHTKQLLLWRKSNVIFRQFPSIMMTLSWAWKIYIILVNSSWGLSQIRANFGKKSQQNYEKWCNID